MLLKLNCKSLIKTPRNLEQKKEMIKNLGQKNDGTTSSLSNFNNLEAVPPTVNCSMTSLTKVDKNHGQKNEMIKNLGQKNDGTTSFLSNFDNLEAVPLTVNCSMTSLTKVDKNHGQKNEIIKNLGQKMMEPRLFCQVLTILKQFLLQ